METKVDLNKDFTQWNRDRDFKKELDDFVYGGYVDYVRRDESGVYVFMYGDWIPVQDWTKLEFPGARDLTCLARYFYNMGKAEAREALPASAGAAAGEAVDRLYKSGELTYPAVFMAGAEWILNHLGKTGRCVVNPGGGSNLSSDR